jgi:hypothetical protein
MNISKNIEKITNDLNNKIIEIEKNHFDEFNNSLIHLTENLQKINIAKNKNKQNIIDKLFLLNQELFKLQGQFDDLNYELLKDNIEDLNDVQKNELQEYEQLDKMKKKYYGLLAIDYFT